MQGNLRRAPKDFHLVHDHKNKQYYPYFFLKGLWIETITSILLFILHEYKNSHANYFRKFKNIKAHGYFSLNPTEEVIGYNILQEEKFEFYKWTTSYKIDEHLDFLKCRFGERSSLSIENNANYRYCHWDYYLYSHELE